MLLEVPIGVMSQINTGKIRGLALLAKERVPAIKEIPTIVESGGPPIVASSWSRCSSRPGRNAQGDHRQSLSGGDRSTEGATSQRRPIEQAVVPIGHDPGRSSGLPATEFDRWEKVINTAGVKVEG